jgi:septin 3/9/12
MTQQPDTTIPHVIQPTFHVGFDSITKQIEKRLLKRGFQFNIMVVGQSGLGKTTLVNSLFASHLANTSSRVNSEEKLTRTPKVKVVSQTIEENGVRFKINIIDTPGYGDQINNEGCWDPIHKYIKEQHVLYLRQELTAQRKPYLPDTRVHCVLFFIQPNGHGLKPIDITVLKKLSETANVVPVIAKSDSMTLAEREAFKNILQKEFAYHRLRLYPNNLEDYDEEERQVNARIREMLPFAIVGSENTIMVDGKQVRGRKTRWGVIDIENETHCEFPHLRKFLISTRLQDLIETTAQIYYEKFRFSRLTALKENSLSQSGATANGPSTASQKQQQHSVTVGPAPMISSINNGTQSRHLV